MRKIFTIISLAAIALISCRKDIVDPGSAKAQLQQLSAVDKSISAKLHSGTFSKADLMYYIHEKQKISSELKASGLSDQDIETAISEAR